MYSYQSLRWEQYNNHRPEIVVGDALQNTCKIWNYQARNEFFLAVKECKIQAITAWISAVERSTQFDIWLTLKSKRRVATRWETLQFSGGRGEEIMYKVFYEFNRKNCLHKICELETSIKNSFISYLTAILYLCDSW